MTAYDTAVSMLKEMPESDLQKVLAFIRETFSIVGERTSIEEIAENPFRPLSEDEVFDRLEDTRIRVENGEPLYNAHYASSFVREKYGLKHV